MISKKELLEKIAEAKFLYGVAQSRAFDTLADWALSLPDDQPDLLPFQWPIPEGMEVVTRDGRKVEQLTNFEAKEEDFPLIGVLGDRIEGWTLDGLYSAGTVDVRNDLFLRRVEKKVWVVDYNNGKYEVFENRPTEGVFGSTHYEATLKPAV